VAGRRHTFITAAGLVLAGTLSTLTQLPDVAVAEVGIAVVVGVLLNTLVVRTRAGLDKTQRLLNHAAWDQHVAMGIVAGFVPWV
jgi:hypothetical protein